MSRVRRRQEAWLDKQFGIVGGKNAVVFRLDAYGLRVDISCDLPRPQLLFERTNCLGLECELRGPTIIAEAEAAPLAHNDRDLPAIEERVPDDQRLGRYRLSVARS